MNKHTIEYLFLLSLILFSCKRDFSVTDTYNIHLTLESAEVTETWLRLKATPVDTETIYTVKRDTHTVFFGKLNRADTLLHDENLEPNHTYKYLVWRGTSIVAKEFITTMDTTSHNFEWQTFEFGDHSSSYLSDVAIVNENDIWAVGKIYTDSGDFNAAHWDGSRWSLKKIKVRLQYSSTVFFTENDPIRSIFLSQENDIWFVSHAGGVTRYKDDDWIMMEIPYGQGPGRANKIWGSSSDNMYFAGSNGNITHYNGQTWQKLDSGTDVDINDIWGVYDEQTGEDYILCTVSEKYSVSEYKLLKINKNNSVKQQNWPFHDRTPYSVWFRGNHNIFVAGDGIRVLNRIGVWKEFPRVSRYFKNCIRGNAINDIFITGEFLLLAHFNGLTWKEYTIPQSGKFYALDYKKNTAVAVGRINNKAIIMMTN